MSAFLSVDLLIEFAAFCLTDFIDWRYIHSWFVFSTQLVNCCPHGRRNYTCVLLPLYCTFSLTPSPPSQCTVYADSVWLWGWGVLKCTVDHILQEFYTLFLTRFRTYNIASPPQTKMTSKDDIKGLVSLKFLRPWSGQKGGKEGGRVQGAEHSRTWPCKGHFCSKYKMAGQIAGTSVEYSSSSNSALCHNEVLRKSQIQNSMQNVDHLSSIITSCFVIPWIFKIFVEPWFLLFKID